jgi:hypothetical protein
MTDLLRPLQQHAYRGGASGISRALTMLANPYDASRGRKPSATWRLANAPRAAPRNGVASIHGPTDPEGFEGKPSNTATFTGKRDADLSTASEVVYVGTAGSLFFGEAKMLGVDATQSRMRPTP